MPLKVVVESRALVGDAGLSRKRGNHFFVGLGELVGAQLVAETQPSIHTGGRRDRHTQVRRRVGCRRLAVRPFCTPRAGASNRRTLFEQLGQHVGAGYPGADFLQAIGVDTAHEHGAHARPVLAQQHEGRVAGERDVARRRTHVLEHGARIALVRETAADVDKGRQTVLGFGEALHLLEQLLIDQLVVVEVEPFAVGRGHDHWALAPEGRVNLGENGR